VYDVAKELARAIEFHRTGRFHEAEAVYRQVLQADAATAQAPYLLAALCDTTGRVDEAVSQLMCLLERQPDHAAAQNHLGAILADRDELDAAIAHFEAALRAKPTWNEPRQNLTKALAARFNRQGVELAAEGKLELAVTCYREALAVQPNDVAAQGNLGNALRLQGNWVEAEVCYRRVLALVPDSAEAHYSLGVARGHLLRWDDANLHLRRAIELQPDYVDAHGALGRVMLEQGLADDALVCFRRNVELAPNSADAHFRLAFALLLTGRFAEGWREYEWRLVGKELDGPPLAQPRWDGSPLAGRTILVRCEQGYGDTLQFIRFAELLKQQGASVIVECRAPLVRICCYLCGRRSRRRPRSDSAAVRSPRAAAESAGNPRHHARKPSGPVRVSYARRGIGGEMADRTCRRSVIQDRRRVAGGSRSSKQSGPFVSPCTACPDCEHAGSAALQPATGIGARAIVRRGRHVADCGLVRRADGLSRDGGPDARSRSGHRVRLGRRAPCRSDGRTGMDGAVLCARLAVAA